MKPAEFYYQIRKIEVIQEGTRMIVRRNEITRKANAKEVLNIYEMYIIVLQQK